MSYHNVEKIEKSAAIGHVHFAKVTIMEKNIFAMEEAGEAGRRVIISTSIAHQKINIPLNKTVK